MRRLVSIYPGVAISLVVVFAGCSSNGTPPVAPIQAGGAPTSRPTSAPSSLPSVSPSATAMPSVAPSATPTPTPRPTASPAPTPTPTPTASPAPPPAGQIYVADFAKNSVFVYAANPSGTMNETPLATIAGSNTGLDQPQGIAVDASGKIYVANDVPNSGSAGILTAGGYITVYAANPSGTLNETPLATLTPAVQQTGGVLPGFPSGITLDSSGNIYLATGDYGEGGGGSVLVFPPNPSGTVTESPTGTISTVSFAFTAVALDAGRRIYVVNPFPAANAPPEVNVFAANPSGTTTNTAPVATIYGTNTGMDNPYGVALDASGQVYVANFGEYAPAVSSITVYASNPSGTLNETPLATIAGTNTALVNPTTVAIDASGKIYVGNSGASITVYAANPSGTLNETPIATISGTNTGLTSPPNSLTGFGQPITLTVH